MNLRIVTRYINNLFVKNKSDTFIFLNFENKSFLSFSIRFAESLLRHVHCTYTCAHRMQAKAPRIELANEFLEIFMLGASGPNYPCISRRPRDVGARLGNNFLRGLLHLRIVLSFCSRWNRSLAQRQLFVGNSWKRISFQIRDETNTIDWNERQRRRIINPSLGNRVIYFFKNMQK